MTRKLASIRKIQEIKLIPDAEKICAYRVDGWWVVDSINKYKVDDLVIYLETDSWVPNELAPFLSKGKDPREYNGVPGERLRTVKLRGQISQGLLLMVAERVNDSVSLSANDSTLYVEGDDVTEALGIQKWERPIPSYLSGMIKGNFPSLIPKTDQERVQNLVNEIKVSCDSKFSFEVTEKLEGSSMTCYIIDGQFGVCSRNLDLKQDEANSFWKIAIQKDIETKLRSLGRDIAIQGELIGAGVQGNIYQLSGLDFYVFDVYDIKNGEYLYPKQRRDMVKELGLNHVPVILEEAVISQDIPGEVDSLLVFADGKSALNTGVLREGLVFKQTNGGMTFKAVSNQYLIKEK